MATVVANYNSEYGTKFFDGNTTAPLQITSYHGIVTATMPVYGGILVFNNSSGVRLGTLMVSYAEFTQRYTNTHRNEPTITGTSTAAPISGYPGLYGYLVTSYADAYPVPLYMANYTIYVDQYTSLTDFLNEVYSDKVPITYRDTNCQHYGVAEAAPGDTVEVSYSFTNGYGIVNPSSDIYVTNNGVLVPSTYADGKLTFTMPDPS